MNVESAPIDLLPGKRIYFASDFHFGIPDYSATRAREIRICKWLDSVKQDAQQIYLLGDLFDSWMEYKLVVPKGYVRFLGKLAELADAGIEIIVFTGNHDLWMHGYFEQELGIKVFKHPQTIQIGSKQFHLGHGDGLSPQESTYRIMKYVLHHPVSQWIYRQLHPDLGLRLADYFSRLGPKHKYADLSMKEPEQEYQLQYAEMMLKKRHFDYFIFGHRHIPCCMELTSGAIFINLGDWISYDTYAVFDGQTTVLSKY
jgi:UDP-2,3-diacylglucosamine hydrolase